MIAGMTTFRPLPLLSENGRQRKCLPPAARLDTFLPVLIDLRDQSTENCERDARFPRLPSGPALPGSGLSRESCPVSHLLSDLAVEGALPGGLYAFLGLDRLGLGGEACRRPESVDPSGERVYLAVDFCPGLLGLDLSGENAYGRTEERVAVFSQGTGPPGA